MQKESSVAKICDIITKYSIYVLIFLVPIFFLPWTSDALDFNKQAVMILLVFISLFAWMIKIFVSGKLEINKSFMHIVAGILFLTYFLATIFSINKSGSFWGFSQQTSESMLTVVCLLLFYFLLSNTFSKNDIIKSTIILSFSAIIAELIGVLQLFSFFIIPFDFAKSAAFNMIGSVGDLGFFAAIFLPLAIVLLIIVKKWWRYIFVLQIVLSFFLLILINYPIIWWVVIIGSAMTLILGTIKSNLFDGRWMALPMFFLVVSLFFVFLNPQINLLPQKANEIFLSQKAGLDIAIKTIKERPIFGSGPGTFAYDFSKFKSPDFSSSSFWNVIFNKSSSKVLNRLATTGVLGFLAVLAFMAFPIFYVVKLFITKNKTKDVSGSEKSSNQVYSILLLGLSVVLIEQSIAYFLYDPKIVLDFILFFTIAALIGLISKNKEEYALKRSSLLTLATTFVFILVFIFGMGVLILDGQRYMAEVDYYKGLVAYQAGQKTDGLNKFESAASLNPKSDLYFRQLSRAYLLGLQDELKNASSTGQATLTDQEKIKIQNLEANSVNAGKMATDLNPWDVNNWFSYGDVCQSLIGILNGADICALNSYDSALKLDPNNPYLFFQEGNVYLTNAISLPSSASVDQKNQLLATAQSQLEKAVALNPTYSEALYSLGLVYDYSGQKDKAIDAFTKLQQLNPINTDISNILANLKAGKPILQVVTPPAVNSLSETKK